MTQKIQNSDLRVKRTEKLIIDALIQCTIKKGFASVTVSDITSEAGINRATFYRHYKDKFDLLHQYARTIFALLDTDQSSIAKEAPTPNRQQIHTRLVTIFNHVRDNAQFYRVMWGKHGNPDFTEKIRMYIQKRIRKSLQHDLLIDEIKLDLFVSYSASASFGVVLWWLEHDMPYSSDEMIEILLRIESENLKALLK